MQTTTPRTPHDLVRFGLVDGSLGRTLVALSGTGVCAIAVGDDDAALEAALRHDVRDATLVRDDAAVAAIAPAIEAAVAGARAAVPMDLRGTAFQRRVWAALCAIPRGETRSYAEVAAALGLPPTAARAVARACATNPVALLVPCHRVVRGTGDLSGYRWGVERKARLLAMEKARLA